MGARLGSDGYNFTQPNAGGMITYIFLTDMALSRAATKAVSGRRALPVRAGVHRK
jgi:hypothetical protein